MRTIKQFRFVLIILGVLVALFYLPGCSNPSSVPTSSNSCLRPNPLVTFDALNSNGFSVTPDTLAQVTSVVIEVTGSTGAPKTTFDGKPGLETIINLDTAYQRPLLLKFAYKAANGAIIAEDQLRVDDTRSHGVTLPDMDIVMGVTGFPTCPGTTQTVNVSTNNGVSVFNWNPGEAFEVQLTYSGTMYKFRVHPVAGQGDDAGTVTIYERPTACLSDLITQVVSTKEIAITSISTNCTVKAYNNGSTNRTVTITHPTGATISVSK